MKDAMGKWQRVGAGDEEVKDCFASTVLPNGHLLNRGLAEQALPLRVDDCGRNDRSSFNSQHLEYTSSRPLTVASADGKCG
eukprot:1215852-Pyramimonas_sp.AAC.1